MTEDEAKEKIIAYIECRGIDLKTINFARVVFRIEGGEVVDHKFLDDDEPAPTNVIAPQPKNSIH